MQCLPLCMPLTPQVCGCEWSGGGGVNRLINWLERCLRTSPGPESIHPFSFSVFPVLRVAGGGAPHRCYLRSEEGCTPGKPLLCILRSKRLLSGQLMLKWRRIKQFGQIREDKDMLVFCSILSIERERESWRACCGAIQWSTGTTWGATHTVCMFLKAESGAEQWSRWSSYAASLLIWGHAILLTPQLGISLSWVNSRE